MNHISKARDLRRQQTQAETMFWNAVRNRQFFGMKWRRQVPVDRYIVDFLCEEKKAVVELDGSHHGREEQLKYDAERTKVLDDYGYRVFRFLNDEIKGNLDGVLNTLAQELGALNSPHPTTPIGVSTSPQGEVS